MRRFVLCMTFCAVGRSGECALATWSSATWDYDVESLTMNWNDNKTATQDPMNYFVDNSSYQMCFYHALFCHLTSSCGGSRKRASQPSSTSGVLPAFSTLLAPPPPIENEIEWIFPDLAIMQGSGAAAALTKYIRDALRLLPQFANSHLIQQFSGKSLRRGKCSCNVSFLTI